MIYLKNITNEIMRFAGVFVIVFFLMYIFYNESGLTYEFNGSYLSLQLFLLAMTVIIGYVFVELRFKKKMDKELMSYKREVENYRSRRLKDKKVQKKLRKELRETKSQLNTLINKLELKSKDLEELKSAIRSYKTEVERVEESKNLYEDYISWSEKLKEFFGFFLISSEIYVSEKRSSISISTSENMKMDIKSKKPQRLMTSVEKGKVKDYIMNLIQFGVVSLKPPQKGQVFDYKITLTEKGTKIKKFLISINK